MKSSLNRSVAPITMAPNNALGQPTAAAMRAKYEGGGDIREASADGFGAGDTADTHITLENQNSIGELYARFPRPLLCCHSAG